MMGPSLAAALGRWFRTPRARIGLGLLVITAVFTAGMLIWSMWNPGERVQNMPAALVNEDTGATVGDQTLQAGNEVADKLIAADDLAWEVTSFDDAQKGLNSGRYALVVRIPAGFSQQVASLDSGQPAQATIDAYTNDATNYFAASLAEGAVASTEKEISADLTLNFIDQVYSALPQAKQQGESAVAGAQAVSEQTAQANTLAAQVVTSATATNQQAQAIAGAAGAAATAAKKVVEGGNAAATVAQDISAVSATIATGGKSVDASLTALEQQLRAKGQADSAATVAAIRTNLASVVLNPANSVSQKAAGQTTATRQIAADGQAAQQQVAQAQSAATGLVQSATDTQAQAQALATQLSTLQPKTEELAKGLSDAAAKVPPVSDAQRDQFTKVLAQPIDIQLTRQNAVGDLGEGMAPLFLPIGLFLGALAIVGLARAYRRPLLDFGHAAWKAVAVPWLSGGVWAVAQVLLLVGMIAVLLDFHVAAWPPFIAMLLLTSACFLSMLQLLKAAFGPGGGFLAAALVLVLQVSASAGTFPTATLGKFFALLQPVMPMSYAVDGLRRTIAGGPLTPFVWIDVAVLLLVAVACFGATVLIASRRRALTPGTLHPTLVLD